MMDQVTHFLFLAALILIIIFLTIMLSSMSCFKGWMKKEGQKLDNFYGKVEKIPGKITIATCKTCNDMKNQLCDQTDFDLAEGWAGADCDAVKVGTGGTHIPMEDQLWYNSNCIEDSVEDPDVSVFSYPKTDSNGVPITCASYVA
jgi:hypothetical protein